MCLIPKRRGEVNIASSYSISAVITSCNTATEKGVISRERIYSRQLHTKMEMSFLASYSYPNFIIDLGGVKE